MYQKSLNVFTYVYKIEQSGMHSFTFVTIILIIEDTILYFSTMNAFI